MRWGLMPSVCLAGTPLKSLSTNAKVTVRPGPGCDPTKTQLDYILDLPMTHKVAIHRSCVCNEEVALYNRHLLDRRTDKYDPAYIRSCFTAVKRDIMECMNPVTPISFMQVINRYRGAKRASYIRAWDEIKTIGFQRRWANVTMFVKPDKYAEADIQEKAPRAIQYRRPAFNLSLARFLHPYEKELYQIKPKFNGEKLCIAKGRNNQQRAEDLIDLIADFEDPCFLLIDHSKFDSSCTVDHFKEIHKMYLEALPSKELRSMLKMQLFNKGRTQGGIIYRVNGTKMSGDYNTALDNTLLNLIVLYSWLKDKVKARYYLDGDDSVVIIERKDEHLLDMNHFERFGFVTVMQRVYEPSSIEFCRSKLLDISKPVFARNPYRALSNMCCSVKYYEGKARLKYLAGNALGEMHRSSGVPVLFPAAKAIYEKYGKHGIILDTQQRYKMDLFKVDEFPPITLEAREAFQVAFGISIATQLELEQEIPKRIVALKIDSIQTFATFFSLPDSALTLKDQYASEETEA